MSGGSSSSQTAPSLRWQRVWKTQPDGGSAVLNGGLFLTDIGLYPQPGVEVAKLICEEIRETLVELIDERPEARLLLSGRTFARALH